MVSILGDERDEGILEEMEQSNIIHRKKAKKGVPKKNFFLSKRAVKGPRT